MRAQLATLLLLLTPCMGGTIGDAHPLRNVQPGESALPFSLKDAKGRVHQLEQYKGKPLVLCYFRPGQSFSDDVLNVLGKAHAQFSGKGVAFLALRHSSSEDSSAPAQGLPFPILDDDQREFYGSWGLFILPTTIVLDREHKVRAAFGSRQADFEEALTHSINGVLGIKEAPQRPAEAAAPSSAAAPELHLAQGMLDRGRAQEALAMLEPQLKKKGADCHLQTLASEALLNLKRPAEAKPLLAACLKADPSSGGAALLMGRALTMLGEYGPAEEHLKAAMMRTPGNPATRYYLGELYEKTGRKDQALAEYRTALERLLSR